MDHLQRAREVYLIGRLHDALEAAQAACDQRPKDAEAWWLLGCISRHTGLPQASEDAFRRASQISGRSLPVRVTSDRFQQLVAEAQAGSGTAAQDDQTKIRIEELPDEELVRSGVRPDALQHRGTEGTGVVTLYQVNLENRCTNEDALRDLIGLALRTG
jgi:hypothetical protein